MAFVIKLIFTLLLFAGIMEGAAIVGDLMSAASDLAVVAGLILLVVITAVGAKVFKTIWRRRE